MTTVADIKKALMASRVSMQEQRNIITYIPGCYACDLPKDLEVDIGIFQNALLAQGADKFRVSKSAHFADWQDDKSDGLLNPWIEKSKIESRVEEERLFSEYMDGLAQTLHDRYFSKPRLDTGLISPGFGVVSNNPVYRSNKIKLYDLAQDVIGAAATINGKDRRLKRELINPDYSNRYHSTAPIENAAAMIFGHCLSNAAGLDLPLKVDDGNNVAWRESSEVQDQFFLNFRKMSDAEAIVFSRFLNEKYGPGTIEDVGPEEGSINEISASETVYAQDSYYAHRFKMDINTARKMLKDIDKQLDLIKPDFIRTLQSPSGAPTDFK